ncbi:MAG TPA: hypothetical protein VKQ30_18790 [Ktedonobacterales bacterium]|nr:hypothetical protein [Ktedonobacterales bacterium]
MSARDYLLGVRVLPALGSFDPALDDVAGGVRLLLRLFGSEEQRSRCFADGYGQRGGVGEEDGDDDDEDIYRMPRRLLLAGLIGDE